MMRMGVFFLIILLAKLFNKCDETFTKVPSQSVQDGDV